MSMNTKGLFAMFSLAALATGATLRVADSQMEAPQRKPSATPVVRIDALGCSADNHKTLGVYSFLLQPPDGQIGTMTPPSLQQKVALGNILSEVWKKTSGTLTDEQIRNQKSDPALATALRKNLKVHGPLIAETMGTPKMALGILGITSNEPCDDTARPMTPI